MSISLTGHRPKDLWGYNFKDKRYLLLEQKLWLLLNQYLKDYDVIECHSGMALGADLLWAKVIVKAKQKFGDRIVFIADVPHPKQSDPWPKETKEFYNKLLNNSDEQVVYAEEYSTWCMQKRNIGMLDSSDVLFSIWNGSIKEHSGTSNAIKHAIKTDKEYFILDPFSPEIKKEKINKELISLKRNFYSKEEIKNQFDITINEYLKNHYIIKEKQRNRIVLEKGHNNYIIILLKKEVINKKYYTFTIKEYSSRNLIYMKNINNKSFKYKKEDS